jgi:hypothetical protein
VGGSLQIFERTVFERMTYPGMRSDLKYTLPLEIFLKFLWGKISGEKNDIFEEKVWDLLDFHKAA